MKMSSSNQLMNILLYSCLTWLCHAAVVPNYQGLPLSVWQQIHSRPNERLLSDHFETYGYVDRYPPGERANRELVFGIPHRYSDTYRSYEANENTDLDTYPDALNPYWNTYRQANLNKRTFRYPNLDLLEPIYPDAEMTSADVDYPHAEPNPQDVVNFERYLQRYFDGQKTANVWENSEDDENALDWQDTDAAAAAAAGEDDDVLSSVDNDEEAAIQLHSLVTPRKQQASLFHLQRPLGREIQKKSDSTSAPKSATTTTTTTSSPPLLNSKQQGQKEEPLLRPPTTQRHVPQQTELHVAEIPESFPEENSTNTRSIFNTIKRLFKMHNQLQDVPEERISGPEPRMKRFVSQEDSLLNELHSLNKVKA